MTELRRMTDISKEIEEKSLVLAMLMLHDRLTENDAIFLRGEIVDLYEKRKALQND